MIYPEFKRNDVVKIIKLDHIFIAKKELIALQHSGYLLDCGSPSALNDNSILAYEMHREEIGNICTVEDCILSQGTFKYGLRFADGTYKAWYSGDRLLFISRNTLLR